jgi:replicative DNA helicase
MPPKTASLVAAAVETALPARTLPANLQAEAAVLGALLLNNEAFHRVSDFLLTEHFLEPVHQRIFEAMRALIERGMLASPVTLKHTFDKDPALATEGGAEYLIKLTGLGSSILNIDSYSRLVYDLAVRRNLIHIGEEIVNDAYDAPAEEKPAKEQIEEAEQKLFQLASEGINDNNFAHLRSSLNDALKRVDLAYKQRERISGISTGLHDLDELLGGLQNSDLLILAARPSMGKTALAVNIALSACRFLQEHKVVDSANIPASVGFFSLEMSSEQLAARMMAMEAEIESSKLRSGNLSETEYAKLVQANSSLHNLPFFIDDTPALSISALRTRARRLKRRHNLSLLIVDYLQLVRGFGVKKEENRVQEISAITQGLKAIAKELNLPVIALSQLSRAVEQRPDKRPLLSDLRESGSIEQDADVVMFIYREEYYVSRRQPAAGTEEYNKWLQDSERCMNLAEVIIAKQRNGPIGTATVHFHSSTTRFSNHTDHQAIPSQWS